MDQSTLTALRTARDLLRTGQTEQARPILVELIKQDPNLEHAWYLLGFALSDPKQQIYAFQRVLQINPQNEKAKKQLAALSGASQEVTPDTTTTSQSSSTQEIADEEQISENTAPVSETYEQVKTPSKPKRRIFVILLVVVGLILVAGLVGGLMFSRLGSAPWLGFLGPTQTVQVAVSATNSPIPLPTSTPLHPTSPPSTPGSIPTPTSPSRSEAFQEADCDFEVPQEADVECGFVSVPENRESDSDNTVRLYVAIYHSFNPSPATDPIIFLQGGPGSKAVQPFATYFESFIAPMLNDRDFIIFDQRGAGLSEPSLDCPELSAVKMQDLRGELRPDELATSYSDAFLACHDRLTGSGVDLAAYTSAASATDINEIISALGYNQVNLFGVSYGTRLALTVMREYPEIVRSAVLDSSLPLETRLYNETTSTADYALNTLFAGCAEDSGCSAAYPDLETVFFGLVSQLDAQPITVTLINPLTSLPYDVSLSGSSLINATLWGMYSSYLIPILPKAIYSARQGDTSLLSEFFSVSTMTYDDISIGAKASIECHEQVYATTLEDLEADLAAFPRLEAYGRASLYGSPENLFAICDSWGAAPFDPDDSQPLISSLPTLILAGEYDPVTPPSFGKQIAANLENSDFIEIPGQGHAPAARGWDVSCPLTVTLTYINDPIAGPDASCVTEMSAPQFVVPFTGAELVDFESFNDAEAGIAGVVPAGWKAIGSGFYNRSSYGMDVTQLGVQRSVVSSSEWLQWLNVQFQQVGLDLPPTFANQRQANGLNWKLYTSEFRGNPVDIALAEGNGYTLMVVLLSEQSEHVAIYEAVFLPAIDALVPSG